MQIAKLTLSLQRVQNRTRAKDTKKGAIVQILKLKEDERKYRDKGMGNERLQGKGGPKADDGPRAVLLRPRRGHHFHRSRGIREGPHIYADGLRWC